MAVCVSRPSRELCLLLKIALWCACLIQLLRLCFYTSYMHFLSHFTILTCECFSLFCRVVLCRLRRCLSGHPASGKLLSPVLICVHRHCFDKPMLLSLQAIETQHPCANSSSHSCLCHARHVFFLMHSARSKLHVVLARGACLSHRVLSPSVCLSVSSQYTAHYVDDFIQVIEHVQGKYPKAQLFGIGYSLGKCAKP